VGSRLVAGGMSLNTMGEHLGQINLVMKDRTHDKVEEAAVNDLRKKFEAIPDVEAKFGRPSYFSLKTPIEVVLYGEDLDVLRDYSLDLTRDLQTVPGLVDVRSSLEAGNPELQVVFNRDQLAALHLDLATMSSTLQDRVQGAVPTRYKEADRQIDVRIRNRESDRHSINDVENLVLPGPNGAPIRLVSIADVHVDQGPAEIHRLQQQRAAVVSANLADRSLAGAVRDVRATLAKNPPPQGISAELAGQQAEMSVSFNSLRFAMILAVFLVYIVMAATFESFIHPLIVLFTIPLAIVGVVLGLLVTNTDISVMVLIGVILLVGVVVNNAIVLIDCVNRLRRAGVDKLEAVVRAGHIRLRPILMSTLTTVLGLIPMAISWGEGSELRAPLAITVFWGLSVATLLTLVVIPAAYLVVPSNVTVETPLPAEEQA
jgi:HAE1 family hydrophobic/amphiphilic exporter-1